MDPLLIGMVSVIGSFAMTIVVVIVLVRARQRRLELQTEVQTKLIERFGSSPELIDFLQSPAGRDFVMGVQSIPVREARERVIAGIRRSIVLAALGFAFIALGALYTDELYFPGFILFALGVGYGVASWVSIRLSQSLQLGAGTPPPPPPPRNDGSIT